MHLEVVCGAKGSVERVCVQTAVPSSPGTLLCASLDKVPDAGERGH